MISVKVLSKISLFFCCHDKLNIQKAAGRDEKKTIHETLTSQKELLDLLMFVLSIVVVVDDNDDDNDGDEVRGDDSKESW